MRAMALTRIASIEKRPLEIIDLPEPSAGVAEVVVKVLACGACHTELDEIEGRLKVKKLPIVLGHQVVGKVIDKGKGVKSLTVDDRVGVTWLNNCCGKCRFCISGRENLCEYAMWTGLDVNGGYAEFMSVDERFAYPIPNDFGDCEAAPLLCAGVIGYRAFRIADIKETDVVGLFGFGASAHIVIQIIKHKYPDGKVFVFTRGQSHRRLAEELGAHWCGGLDDKPSVLIDKAIDFTPIGETVLRALAVSNRGAKIIINAIRKSTPVPELEYGRYLWHEREVKSVANVTRRDALEFLPLAAEIPIRPRVERFELGQANDVLAGLKQGNINGAAVFEIG
jgi:propanol-preferring alcohol dehydrogenase